MSVFYTVMTIIIIQLFIFSPVYSATLTHGPVVGATTSNSVSIFTRTDQSSTVDIIYSINPSLDNFIPSESFVTILGSDFTKVFELKSLSPSTVYYYTPRVNGIPALKSPYPSFKTFPSTNVAEFAFLVFTDFSDHLRPQWANGPAIRAAQREHADFALIGGDFSHAERQTLEDKRTVYKTLYDCAKTGRDLCGIFKRMPAFHIWDDHDLGANNADKTYANKELSLQVYNEYFPAPPLVNPDAGIWHSFKYAQAEFFMLDVRYQRDPNSVPDGPNKSMLDGDALGAEGQLEWLKKSLQGSTARWKFIVSGSVFNPTAKGPANSPDSWGGFKNEHAALVDFIKDHNIQGVIVLTGDLHTGGAFDDGTHSGLPELNVPHANLSPCFVDTFAGVFGNWSYLLTGYGNPGYGLIEVKTNPDRIILSLKSYDGALRKGWVIDEQNITTLDGPFQPPRDLGYFIWKDSSRQTWGLCWRGDQFEHRFDGEITSDGTFQNVKRIALEASDVVAWDPLTPSSIRFDASASRDQDGFLFKATGNVVTFDVKQDGEYRPEFMSTGIDTLIPAVWSRFRHDALHTGQSLYRGHQSPTLKWQYQSAHQIFSSPALGMDGTIYIAGLDKILRAFNPAGSIKWEFNLGDQSFSSPCIAEDGTIYVGSNDTYLYAIDSDGILKWRFKTNDIIRSSANISHDRSSIIIGSNDGYIYSVNLDGKLRWKFFTGSPVPDSASIGVDGMIYVASGNTVYALKPDGVVQWSVKLNNWIGASPVIDESNRSIYIGSWDGYFYCLSVDGTLKWKVKTGGRIYSSAAIGFDHTVYVGSLDEYLYAISPQGEVLWKFLATGCSDCICEIIPPQHPNCNEIESSPAIDLDGTIYVGSHDSFLYAINPNGTLKWRFHADDWINSSPAIGSDGTIYFGSRDKTFYAIGH